jgi:ribonuclease HIII
VAISDQFGRKDQIERALLQKGRRIELRQRPRAEADVGVAAASILARDGFLAALAEMRLRLGMEVPKGSSPQAREAAVAIARKHGPAALLETVKCHFKTTDEVLASLGLTRDALGPDGRAVSRAARPRPV